MSKKKQISYDGYSQDNDKYYVLNKPINKIPSIKSGFYRLDYDMAIKQAYLYETELNHDNIVDLPSDEYREILRTMNRFLLPEVKEAYHKLGYLYKRNILMYGEPGSGKTILVNRIAESAVKDNDAVCIFVDNSTANAGVSGLQVLEKVLNWFRDTNPDTLLVLIMEEIDEMIENHEHKLLVFLDGQMQRPNTIVLGTTNFIKDIPPRFLRPGRFSQTVEVKLPSSEARRHYLVGKLGEDFKDIDLWTKSTEGFTIDDLKEVIQSVHLIGEDFKTVVDRLRKTKSILSDYEIKQDLHRLKERQRNALIAVSETGQEIF